MTKISRFAGLSLGLVALAAAAHANLVKLAPDAVATLIGSSATSLVGSAPASGLPGTETVGELVTTVSAVGAIGSIVDIQALQLDQFVSGTQPGSQPGSGTDSIDAGGGSASVPDGPGTLRLVGLAVVGLVTMRLLTATDRRRPL